MYFLLGSPNSAIRTSKVNRITHSESVLQSITKTGEIFFLLYTWTDNLSLTLCKSKWMRQFLHGRSVRSWRYCIGARQINFGRRSRQERAAKPREIAAPPPKLYFARAFSIPPATQASTDVEFKVTPNMKRPTFMHQQPTASSRLKKLRIFIGRYGGRS